MGEAQEGDREAVEARVAERLRGRPESRADDPVIRQIAFKTVEEAGGADALASDRPIELPLVCNRAQLANGWTLDIPVSGGHKAEATAVLAGRYIHRLAKILGDRKPRRVLDLGAGIGGFALWAGIAWPFSWIDCWEGDPRIADVCKRNLPPGGRMLEDRELIDLEVNHYDVIRVTELTALASGNILRDFAGVLIVDAIRYG